jgi:hypothetical protein
MRWLIVVPFYFFGSITMLLSFILAARLLHLRVALAPLVTGAVALVAGVIAVPLVTGWMTLDEYGGRGLIVLIAASFSLAALETFVRSSVPLPLDEELSEDKPAKASISGRAASIE